MDSLPAQGFWITATALAAEFGISSRTLDRWLCDARLGFPRPRVVRKVRYFERHEIEVISATNGRQAIELIQTTPDRRASDTRDLMHRDDPAATRRPRLDGREMPPATLVKLRAKQPPSLPNRFEIARRKNLTLAQAEGLCPAPMQRGRPAH